MSLVTQDLEHSTVVSFCYPSISGVGGELKLVFLNAAVFCVNYAEQNDA